MDTPPRPPPGIEVRRRLRAEKLRSAQVYDSEAEALMRFRFLPPQGCEHAFVADLLARRGLKPVVGPQGRPGWVWRFDPFLFRHFDFGRPYRDLKQARCPVTLMRGGRSRLITAELTAHAQALAPPGAPELELADADHHLMVDQPQALAGLLDGLVPRA